MEVDPDALAAEFRYLRKGRAFRHPELLDRLGPQLRALCRVTPDDGVAVARRKTRETVETLLRNESRETSVTVLAALALHREADQRDLTARERWLAGQLKCQERTVRRRVDEAFEILVRLSAERDDNRHDLAGPEGWQVQSVRALLNLDGPVPELTEFRTILFLRDGVSEVVTRFSLPRSPAGTDRPHELDTMLLYGGRIREVDRPGTEHFRYFIELPRRFDSHELHEYAIRFRLPPNQPMAPHYALVPLLTVRSLDLTIRFGPRRPATVWRLDGVPPRMIDTDRPLGETLTPDKFGELRLTFPWLRQGLGYGARWQAPEDPSAAQSQPGGS